MLIKFSGQIIHHVRAPFEWLNEFFYGRRHHHGQRLPEDGPHHHESHGHESNRTVIIINEGSNDRCKSIERNLKLKIQQIQHEEKQIIVQLQMVQNKDDMISKNERLRLGSRLRELKRIQVILIEIYGQENETNHNGTIQHNNGTAHHNSTGHHPGRIHHHHRQKKMMTGKSISSLECKDWYYQIKLTFGLFTNQLPPVESVFEDSTLT